MFADYEAHILILNVIQDRYEMKIWSNIEPWVHCYKKNDDWHRYIWLGHTLTINDDYNLQKKKTCDHAEHVFFPCTY